MKPLGQLKIETVRLEIILFFTDLVGLHSWTGAINILSASVSCDRINCGTTDLFVFILSLGTIGFESISSSFDGSLCIPVVQLFTQIQKIYSDDYRLLPNRFLYDGTWYFIQCNMASFKKVIHEFIFVSNNK